VARLYIINVNWFIPAFKPAFRQGGGAMNSPRVKGLTALLLLLLVGCTLLPTPAPQVATVVVTFDLAGGGSGFSLTVYAQEVTTGKSTSQLYSSGAHGGVILPTSAPLVFTLEAPGTYIFYANMINAPEDYHFGATGCGPAPDCPSTVYKAIQVTPGGTYQVYFSDRSGERHAPVPTPHAPVTVPWQK
jgi:hypothetical protein